MVYLCHCFFSSICYWTILRVKILSEVLEIIFSFQIRKNFKNYKKAKFARIFLKKCSYSRCSVKSRKEKSSYGAYRKAPPKDMLQKTLSASYEQNPCAGKTVKFLKFPDVSKIFFSVPGNFSKPWARPTRSSKSAVLWGGGTFLYKVRKAIRILIFWKTIFNLYFFLSTITWKFNNS